MLKIKIIYLCLLIMFSGCTFRNNQLEGRGLLLELDNKGNEIWRSYEYKDPDCLNKDKFGNRLIADLYTKNFFSLDNNNQINWIYFGQFPKYIERVENGNYLLISNDQKYKVYEVDENGKFIKGFNINQNVLKAHKAKNGNYFVLMSNQKILELSADGKKIRMINNSDHNNPEIQKNFFFSFPVNTPIELDNGNFIAIDEPKQRILFFDKDLKLIKTLDGISLNYINIYYDGNIGIAAREYD